MSSAFKSTTQRSQIGPSGSSKGQLRRSQSYTDFAKSLSDSVNSDSSLSSVDPSPKIVKDKSSTVARRGRTSTRDSDVEEDSSTNAATGRRGRSSSRVADRRKGYLEPTIAYRGRSTSRGPEFSSRSGPDTPSSYSSSDTFSGRGRSSQPAWNSNTAVENSRRGRSVSRGPETRDYYSTRGRSSSRQPSVEPKMRQPSVEPKRRQPSVEPKRRQPSVEPRRRQPSVEPTLRQPASAGPRNGHLLSQPSSPNLKSELIKRHLNGGPSSLRSKEEAISNRLSSDSEQSDPEWSRESLVASTPRDAHSENKGASHRLRKCNSQLDLSHFSKQYNNHGAAEVDDEEDDVSTPGSHVEERIIKAVHAQLKSIKSDPPAREVDEVSLYDVMCAEIRRAVADLRTDIEESQRRSQDLWDDLAEEENRCQEFGADVKGLLPSHSAPIERIPRSKWEATEKEIVSQSLDDEARRFFEECVSVSSLDDTEIEDVSVKRNPATNEEEEPTLLPSTSAQEERHVHVTDDGIAMPWLDWETELLSPSPHLDNKNAGHVKQESLDKSSSSKDSSTYDETAYSSFSVEDFVLHRMRYSCRMAAGRIHLCGGKF